MAYFAAKTKPATIIFEDDYSISAAAGPLGCFYDAHIAEFSRREGKAYTREALVLEFGKRDAEALSLQRRYRELMKDSLVGLSEAVRHALDKESPEIPIGTMRSGGSDLDGVEIALAAETCEPVCLLFQ